jgi:hypothetical protein
MCHKLKIKESLNAAMFTLPNIVARDRNTSMVDGQRRRSTHIRNIGLTLLEHYGEAVATDTHTDRHNSHIRHDNDNDNDNDKRGRSPT